MPYSYLLFDADDTLFDFQQAQEKSLDHVFNIIGLPAQAKVQYKTISHHLWQQLERDEITLDQLKEARFKQLTQLYPCNYAGSIELLYEQTLANQADLLPGAKALLENLSDRYHLCLISNGMPQIQYPRLKKAGLLHFFEHLFISEEIGYQKPDSRFFDAVFAVLKVNKEMCLVIGDSITSDMAGGQAYGLDTCYLNFHGQKDPHATYSVASYAELLNIL